MSETAQKQNKRAVWKLSYFALSFGVLLISVGKGLRKTYVAPGNKLFFSAFYLDHFYFFWWGREGFFGTKNNLQTDLIAREGYAKWGRWNGKDDKREFSLSSFFHFAFVRSACNRAVKKESGTVAKFFNLSLFYFSHSIRPVLAFSRTFTRKTRRAKRRSTRF